MTNERPDLDEAFGIASAPAVERPDLDEAFGITAPVASERPDLDAAFGVSPAPAPAPSYEGNLDEAPIIRKLKTLDRPRAEKAASLFSPEVEQEMTPAWNALTESARNAGYFGDRTLGSDADASRKSYEGYRNQLSTDFNLDPEDVDDLVKHRMGLQPEKVSRDAVGNVHIKDDILAKDLPSIKAAVWDSKIPESAKVQAITELPERVQRFKDGVLRNVKQNHPELAATMQFTGDVERDYAALNRRLADTKSEQFGGGFSQALQNRTGQVFNTIGLFADKVTEPLFNRQSDISEAGDIIAEQSKVQESANQISEFINQGKVKILGTNAATIGQGVASGVESIALGAATGGLGNALISADRVAKAGKVGAAVLKFSQGALNTAPIAGFYGADQALSTYDQAIKAGKSTEEAARLAAISGAIEFAVTATFGGLPGLGGLEDVGQKLVNPAVRREVGKSIAKAWGELGVDVTKGLASEITEESIITALDTVAVQAQINPNMTQGDLKKALYDTVIATAFSAGPMVAGGAVREQGMDLVRSRAASQLEIEAAAVLPDSAKASMETGTVLGVDGNPISTETPTLPAPEGFTNDNEQPTPTAPLEVPLPAVQGDELAANPPSESLAPESTATSVEGTTGPEITPPLTNETEQITPSTESQRVESPDGILQEAPTTLTNETPIPETRAVDTPADTESTSAEENIPEGVPEAGIQETPSGPVVGGSEAGVIPPKVRNTGIGSEPMTPERKAANEESYAASMREFEARKAVANELRVGYETEKARLDEKRKALTNKIKKANAGWGTEEVNPELSTAAKRNVQELMVKAKEVDKALYDLMPPTPKEIDEEFQRRNSQPTIPTEQSPAQTTPEAGIQETPSGPVVGGSEAGVAQIEDDYTKAFNDSNTTREDLIELRQKRDSARLDLANTKGIEVGTNLRISPDKVVSVTKVSDQGLIQTSGGTFSPSDSRISATSDPITLPKKFVPVSEKSVEELTNDDIRGVLYSDKVKPSQLQVGDKVFSSNKGVGTVLKVFKNSARIEYRDAEKVTEADFKQTEDAYRIPPNVATRLITATTPTEQSPAQTTPEMVVSEQETAPNVPYSVESLKTAFDLTDEQAVAADAIGAALSARIDSVAKGTGKQKASMEQIAETGKILIRGLQNPDFSSAVHEIAHAARRSMGEVLTEKEVTDVEQWAGVKNGKWGRYSEEKWARAWERYFTEGKAPLSRLQPIFDKIAGWMKDVYQKISGSDIDVEITPEVRAVFDRLAARMETAPETVVSEQETAPNVGETRSNLGETNPEVDYTDEEAASKVAELEAILAEQNSQGIPPPPVQGFTPPAPEEDQVSVMHRYIDAARARYGLAPKMSKPMLKDAEAWDAALAAENEHLRLRKPGTAGNALFNRLLEAPPKALNKLEKALILHELLLADANAEIAQGNLNSVPADADKGDFINATKHYTQAQSYYDLISDYLRAAGSASGLSLQAQKMVVNRDFSLARVVSELKSAKNASSDKPVEWTDKDQSEAVELAQRYQKAQEKIDALEAENTEANRLVAFLTKDLEQAQTKLENQLRTSRSRKLVTEKLNPLVEAAKARMAERAKARTAPTDTQQNLAVFGPTPEMMEDLKDLSIIGAGWLANKSLTLQEFSARLVSEFGEWVAGHAQNIFKQSRSLFVETAESVTGGETPTPASVVESIDATKELDKSDVWKLARAHIVAGERGTKVLDAVFNDLSPKFPELTREQVAEAFTGYGKVVYPSTKEIPKELRRIRSLEREYLKQKDIEKGIMPKRTGYQGEGKKGPEWAEVRAAQQKTSEAMRELENVLREAGLPVPSDERKLTSANEAKKRRLINEMEEIDLALSTRTPRTPKTRNPIAYDEETRRLEEQLKSKRAEYDEVFKDETARERRILGSIAKRKAELERRKEKNDFSVKATLAPVNSEAVRLAQYDLEKVKADFQEKRARNALKAAGPSKKAAYYFSQAATSQKQLVLSGDVGVVLRNIATATRRLAANDLAKLLPGKVGDAARARNSQILQALKAGLSAAKSESWELDKYQKIITRPNAGWDSVMGMRFAHPLDISTSTAEDLPPLRLIEKLPWWAWPTLAAAKATGKAALIASNPMWAVPFGKSLAADIATIALSFGQKPTLLALDRFQRAVTNEARMIMIDMYLDNAPNGVSVEDARAFAHEVLVSTGRGGAKKGSKGILQKFEKSMTFLGMAALAPRYYMSRMLTLVAEPLLFNRMSKDARKQIAINYAKSAQMRALSTLTLAMVLGVAKLRWDDDDPEAPGVILDPKSKDFRRIRVNKNLVLDAEGGDAQWTSMAWRTFVGSIRDRGNGSVNIMTPTERLRNLTSFTSAKINMLPRLITEGWLVGEYFGGKPAGFATTLDEMTNMVMVDDLQNIIKYSPDAETAAVTSALVFAGGSVSSGDWDEEKRKWEGIKALYEQRRKEIEAKANE